MTATARASLVLAAALAAASCASPRTPAPPAPGGTAAGTSAPVPGRAETLLAAGSLQEAVEAAREEAERDPGNPRPWLIQGRAERLLAQRAADAGDGTTAQLRLLDARGSTERAAALAPDDPAAWRERGLALRDSSLFPDAAAAFRRALEVSARPDGETLYDLGYCLAYGGDFAGGLAALKEAGPLLPGDPRIAVNAAICEERLGDRPAAVARLAGFYDLECAAGRGSGGDARRSLEKTWELTVGRLDFDAGVAAFRALADSQPDRPEPCFMLGNLLSFLARHVEGAAAYARSLEAAETPEARVRLARELAAAGAGKLAEADAAAREALARYPGSEELPPVVVRVARAHLEGGDASPARELAAAGRKAWPEDPAFAILEGDACMADGARAAALEAYRAAREMDPFSGEAESRYFRAVLASVRDPGRDGNAAVPDPADLARLADAPAAALDPVPSAETILDFERPGLLIRPLGGTRLLEGALRFPAAFPDSVRGFHLFLFPDLDGTAWTHLDLRLRAEGGPLAVRFGMVDGMDQMSDAPVYRLHWPAGDGTVEVGGEWTTAAVPLRGFEPAGAARAVPALLERVKCFGVEYRGARAGSTPCLLLRSVALRDARSGRTLVLRDLGEGLEEAGVFFDGTCAPFSRILGSREVLQDALCPGSTPVAAHILGTEFDPAMVGRGTGALRVRHGDGAFFPSRERVRQNPVIPFLDGPSEVRVNLGPERDFLRFRAVTFLARGEKGGEKVRVRLEDARSAELAKAIPADRWPRSLFPRTAGTDGAITLSREWRMYRIPLTAYPEVDRGSFKLLAFEVGNEVANTPGAMVYLDEIGLEF